MLLRLLDRFALLVLGHRALFVLGVIAVSAAAGWAALGIRADFTVQELFAHDDPEIARLERFREIFGPDDDQLLVLVEADDVFAPSVLRYVRRLTGAAKELPHFRRVESLTTVSDMGNTEDGAIDTRPLFGTIPDDPAQLAALKKRALGSPLLSGRVAAKDGTLAVVAANLRVGLQRAKDLERVCQRMERLLEATKPPAGVKARLFGVPYVRAEAVRLVKNDQRRFMPLGMLVTTLLLVVLYRSFYEVVVPMLSVSLSAAYTMALMALLDAPIDILSNVLPLLVMVYGVADAVHLLGRIHEQLRAGEARDLAIRTAVRHLGLACLLTSFTTAVGFASLTSASMSILRRFGIFAALGVMVAYVVTLVVAPLGVSLRRVKQGSYVAQLRWLDRLLCAVAAVVTRRPRAVLIGGVLLAVAALGLGSQVEINNYLLGIYREGNPTMQATRLAERKLEGVVRLQVSLVGPAGSMKDPRVLRAMYQLQRWLERQPGVTSSISLVTFIREMHRVVVGQAAIPDTRRGVAALLLMAEGEERINRFIDYPYGKARILVTMRDVGAKRFLPLADRTAARLDRLFSGLGVKARVTGTSLVAYRGINKLVTDLLTSLSVAFLIIAIVLALVFRSLRIGLLSMLPNALPLAVGLGYMTVAGIRLAPATVIIFSIALGIAVDDTIHFFSRYREEVQGGRSAGEAVRATLRTAGRAMVFTSLVLVSGFSVTVLSNFPGTANFGELGAVILLTALFTDLLVTPSCMLVFRPWGARR
jgi:uncharacterized protein